MPLSQISLHRGKTTEYLDALCDGLHDALVTCFDVPPADRFQLIHQHAPGEIRVDSHYLGGPRSADYVLFQITAGKPRTTATKQAFYERLTQNLQRSPGIRPEDVMVVITFNQAEDWSFANGASVVPDARGVSSKGGVA